MLDLSDEIRKCTICKPFLKEGVNPVFAFDKQSKIAIIGQAPGIKVHRSGKPWDDKSGDRLREWLGVSDEEFYDTNNFAIIPMGFCYPGKGKSGDLPPRQECAPKWHDQIFRETTNLKLTILIGSYAQKYYLKGLVRKTLTETVQNFNEYLPSNFVLPHPSPRNNIWIKKNEWFNRDVLPVLKHSVKDALTK